MSQWGAKILADSGSTYNDILSHYYSGLEPEPAPEFVPESVVVGLETGLDSVEFSVEGLANVLVSDDLFSTVLRVPARFTIG